MIGTVRIALVVAGVALATGLGIGGSAAEGDEWEGDHTAIDARVCVDGGGVVVGRICEGGVYTGYIVG
ncbi:hypothetical protein AB0H49_08695 [Nocardia sp. NPDC050713]|uniref:hypothetical protein n=1 Tax=unclassified Nocardia TaxID=2637762 RepID=UPI0033BC1820